MITTTILEFMNIVNTAISFAHSVGGKVVVAISFLSSLAQLISIIYNFKKEEKKAMQKIAKYIRTFWTVLLIVFPIFIGVAILSLSYAVEPLPPNVKLTNEAWKAFNDKKYEQAIRKAEECIKEFERDAIPEQRELESRHADVPIGKVNEADKKSIFNRGLLNDVATCWYIKGSSLEKLSRTQEAIRAYCRAAQFTYARTYDPSWDGFWSPSKKARNSISYLNGTCE